MFGLGSYAFFFLAAVITAPLWGLAAAAGFATGFAGVLASGFSAAGAGVVVVVDPEVDVAGAAAGSGSKTGVIGDVGLGSGLAVVEAM